VFNDNTGTLARNATWPILNNTAYKFITCELNLGLVGESNQVVISVGGIVQTLTFGNSIGAPGAMPSSLEGQPGGVDIVLLAERSTASNSPLVGEIVNIYFLGAAMPGATAGLLTPTARISLRNHNRPT
jgi:hypothetical protein